MDLKFFDIQFKKIPMDMDNRCNMCRSMDADDCDCCYYQSIYVAHVVDYDYESAVEKIKTAISIVNPTLVVTPVSYEESNISDMLVNMYPVKELSCPPSDKDD